MNQVYDVVIPESNLKITLELPSKLFAELDDEQKSAINEIVDLTLKKVALVVAGSISFFSKNKLAGNAMLNNLSDHISSAIMENTKMLNFVEMGISIQQSQSPSFPNDVTEIMFN